MNNDISDLTIFHYKDEKGELIYSEYYKGGKRHREDGPAIEDNFGDSHQYYLNGIRLSKDAWLNKIITK